jgi:hypothetical protein
MVILADRKLIWLMAALALLTLCALTTSPARPLQGRTVKLEYSYSLTVNRKEPVFCLEVPGTKELARGRFRGVAGHVTHGARLLLVTASNQIILFS